MRDVPSVPESPLYPLPILGAGGTSNILVLVMPDGSITHLRDNVVDESMLP